MTRIKPYNIILTTTLELCAPILLYPIVLRFEKVIQKSYTKFNAGFLPLLVLTFHFLAVDPNTLISISLYSFAYSHNVMVVLIFSLY